MTNKDIYNHQYALLSLPKFSTWKAIKSSRKYLTEDLILDSRNQGSIEGDKPLAIMGATYKKSMFSELVYISVTFLSSKKNKSDYDMFLNGDGDVPRELVELVDSFMKDYKGETSEEFSKILSGGFAKLQAQYYSEMYDNELMRLSYFDDIKKSKSLEKVKFSTKYFFEYIIPNYWGYIVLGITFIIFLVGVLYAITK